MSRKRKLECNNSIFHLAVVSFILPVYICHLRRQEHEMGTFPMLQGMICHINLILFHYSSPWKQFITTPSISCSIKSQFRGDPVLSFIVIASYLRFPFHDENVVPCLEYGFLSEISWNTFKFNKHVNHS